MEALKTKKGSRVWYSSYGVGKSIGGKVYVHKDYASDVIPVDVLENAKNWLTKHQPDFAYNCICYNAKENIVRFDEAPDFLTAREPRVGTTISIWPSGKFSIRYSDQIWHHKWLWVKGNFDGFNVKESYEWSKLWLSKLDEPACGTLSVWNNQLANVGLK